jgi:NTE family protein
MLEEDPHALANAAAGHRPANRGRDRTGTPKGIGQESLPPQPAPTKHAESVYLPKRKRHGVALCLSGGGYRAALFHLGAVRRLNELGVLGRIDTITSVSGGSILAAHLANTMGADWPAPGESFPDLDTKVSRTFHRFCERNIRTFPLAAGLLPWHWGGHAAVDALEREYLAHLTKATLTSLPPRPNFVFCATDMSYGVNWTFSRDRTGSYMAGYAPTPARWTVAHAVAASSCFPPFFNPQPMGLSAGDLAPGDDKSDKRGERVRTLGLSDGGLYDNMGLEPVWRSHLVVLVSEGGSTFDAGIDRGLLWRLNRYMEIQGRGGGSVRKRWLISSFVKTVMRGTYWGIGTDIADYDVPVTGYPRDITKGLIAEIRTDLDAFTVAERLVLENHGYVLAQAAIQKHAVFLAIDPMPPLKIPHPYWMDPANMDRVIHGLTGSSDRSLLGRWR